MSAEESLKHYKNALQKVRKLRGLYQHLTLFILSMLFLFFFEPMVPEFLHNQGLRDERVQAWVTWAIQILPLLWSPLMLLHLIGVFGNTTRSYLRTFTPAFLRQWEEKQIRKTLEAMQGTKKNNPKS